MDKKFIFIVLLGIIVITIGALFYISKGVQRTFKSEVCGQGNQWIKASNIWGSNVALYRRGQLLWETFFKTN